MNRKHTKLLPLRTETLRRLHEDELPQIGGGSRPSDTIHGVAEALLDDGSARSDSQP